MDSLHSGDKLSILLVLADRIPIIYFPLITTDEPDTIEGPVTEQAQWAWGRS